MIINNIIICLQHHPVTQSNANRCQDVASSPPLCCKNQHWLNCLSLYHLIILSNPNRSSGHQRTLLQWLFHVVLP